MTGLLQRFKHSVERAGITTEVVTGESGAVAAIAALVERLKAARDLTQATVLISDNPGCLMHLRGTAHPSGRRSLKVRHLAEVLADHLERAGGAGRAG